MHGAAYANYAIQASDLILAVGSRFDDRTTGMLGKYAPVAKAAAEEGKGGFVHFDIGASQIGRVLTPTVGVAGDCKDALKALMPMVDPGTAKSPARQEWVRHCAELKEKFAFGYTPCADNKIKTQQVIEALYNGHRPQDEKRVVSTGVGNHQMMSCQFIRWTQPRSIITSGSLGTMGFGLPAAIGAQVANPDKMVVLVDGDSSFNMTLNDLGTVIENKLPIKIAIMNDFRQQMVVVWQELFFDGRQTATKNVNPDFVQLAEAYGIESFRCSTVEELPGAVERFVSATGPILVDFRVVPDICLPMVAPGKGLDEMFLPGSITLGEKAPVMTGEAPS
jgi:acetolactate synthase-1/2/3 large subunit